MHIVYCDAPIAKQYSFQDAATPIMEGIVDLHHQIFFFLIVILVSVSWILVKIIWSYSEKRNQKPIIFAHNTLLEIIWTIIPAVILMVIAIPSFGLLYSMDEIIDPAITLKAIGHQWYWSYEYSDYNVSTNKSIAFDSYMIAEDDLQSGQLRLLEVDNRVVLPVKTHIRVIVTATDVIHSWAIPAFGVKIDAIPGRLNQVSMFIEREGVYYGQCSELCGVNHGFMPIVVEAVSIDDFIDFIYSKLN